MTDLPEIMRPDPDCPACFGTGYVHAGKDVPEPCQLCRPTSEQAAAEVERVWLAVRGARMTCSRAAANDDKMWPRARDIDAYLATAEDAVEAARRLIAELGDG